VHVLAGQQKLGSVVARAGHVKATHAVDVWQHVALSRVRHHKVKRTLVLEGARQVYEAGNVGHLVHHLAFTLDVVLLPFAQDQPLLAYFNCKEKIENDRVRLELIWYLQV